MGARTAGAVTHVVTYRSHFMPPRPCSTLMKVTQALLPAAARFFCPVHRFSATPEVQAAIREITRGPCILAPNHPTGSDPIALFWLSRFAERPFYFMAAREALEGPRGWYLNKLGAFSVIRGTSDRAAIRMARKILADEGSPLVLFPEGEIYEHNDHLLAFEPGIFQIGFWALEDLAKAGEAARLPVVPVAVKYVCIRDEHDLIERALVKLEEATGLAGGGPGAWYTRILAIADRVLETIGSLERADPISDGDLDARIAAAQAGVVARLVRLTDAKIDSDASQVERLHQLHNAIRTWTGPPPEPEAADYRRRLFEIRLRKAEAMMVDFDRLQNMIGVHSGYIEDHPTQERVLDVIGHLEREVFGAARTKAPREARVSVGTPIRLEEHQAAYAASRRQTLDALVAQLEAELRGLLTDLARDRKPIRSELLYSTR